jgi:hypothetical protein
MACALLIGASPVAGRVQESAAVEPEVPAVVTEVPAAAEAPATPDVLVTVPALTPVFLRIDEELSSKKHKNGDRFAILLDEDVQIGGAVVIPAGSVGEGEVIHAARSGMGGKAGELLVTARFVRVAGREVRLRSFSLGAKGRDRSDQALGLAIVTGPIGLFVVGGVMIIPRGTVAAAKTTEDIQLPATQRSVDTPKGEE